jgi:hypothetical protein
MLNALWTERCHALRVHPLEGDAPLRADRFGVVLAYDGKTVYPAGLFEECGGAAIYPPQTLNPREEETILSAAVGLARMWEGRGVLTLIFAKQRDGSDFALSAVSETLSGEAKHLLTLRGLFDGEGASFLRPGAPAPELLELPVVGVSASGVLYAADDLRSVLSQLPDNIKLTGWYEKFMDHER